MTILGGIFDDSFLGLGIGLINFSSFMGQISGIVFTTIAVGFSFYSLYAYLYRCDLLASKTKGSSYEDIGGALLMVFVVFVAVGINFGLHYLE